MDTAIFDSFCSKEQSGQVRITVFLLDLLFESLCFFLKKSDMSCERCVDSRSEVRLFVSGCKGGYLAGYRVCKVNGARYVGR